MRTPPACSAIASISLTAVSAYADPAVCRAEVFAATQNLVDPKSLLSVLDRGI
jgi:hypothetical protein